MDDPLAAMERAPKDNQGEKITSEITNEENGSKRKREDEDDEKALANKKSSQDFLLERSGSNNFLHTLADRALEQYMGLTTTTTRSTPITTEDTNSDPEHQNRDDVEDTTLEEAKKSKELGDQKQTSSISGGEGSPATTSATSLPANSGSTSSTTEGHVRNQNSLKSGNPPSGSTSASAIPTHSSSEGSKDTDPALAAPQRNHQDSSNPSSDNDYATRRQREKDTRMEKTRERTQRRFVRGLLKTQRNDLKKSKKRLEQEHRDLNEKITRAKTLVLEYEKSLQEQFKMQQQEQAKKNVQDQRKQLQQHLAQQQLSMAPAFATPTPHTAASVQHPDMTGANPFNQLLSLMGGGAFATQQQPLPVAAVGPPTAQPQAPAVQASTQNDLVQQLLELQQQLSGAPAPVQAQAPVFPVSNQPGPAPALDPATLAALQIIIQQQHQPQMMATAAAPSSTPDQAGQPTNFTNNPFNNNIPSNLSQPQPQARGNHHHHHHNHQQSTSHTFPQMIAFPSSPAFATAPTQHVAVPAPSWMPFQVPAQQQPAWARLQQQQQQQQQQQVPQAQQQQEQSGQSQMEALMHFLQEQQQQ